MTHTTPTLGDRVIADWSEGHGPQQTITGVIVGEGDDGLIDVDVGFDDACTGSYGIYHGVHHCAPDWILTVDQSNAGLLTALGQLRRAYRTRQEALTSALEAFVADRRGLTATITESVATTLLAGQRTVEQIRDRLTDAQLSAVLRFARHTLAD